MRLSSMADYAVVTMTAAARHCGTGLPATARGPRRTALNATRLAEETGLPGPTVAKLVSRLAAAGLLHASRGAGGGFRLARPAAAISLAEIIEAVEGPITLTACIHHPGGEPGRRDCALEATCPLPPHWGLVNTALRGALAAVPLSQLVTR